MDAIEESARRVGAPLMRLGSEWTCTVADGALSISDHAGTGRYPLPHLVGAHQHENAGLAAACARALDSFTIDRDAIAEGLRTARWPGRLQRIAWPGLPDDRELWLDGGHNAAAGAALGQAAAGWSDRPLALVVGMLNTKPPTDFLRPLAPFASRLVAVPVEGEPASAAPDEIRDAARSLGIESETAATVHDAIEALAPHAPSGRILVCGSLYLAGQVLAAAGEPAA